MSLGETALLTITGDYAYGEKGYPGLVRGDGMPSLAAWRRGCRLTWSQHQCQRTGRRRRQIPPNATLIFEVQLLEIKRQQQQQQ